MIGNMVTGPVPPQPRTAAELREREEQRLAAARAAFPDWEFIPLFNGWLAVPKDTPVVQSVDLDSMVRKLRERDRQ